MYVKKENSDFTLNTVIYLRLALITFFLFFSFKAYSSSPNFNTISKAFDHFEELSAKDPSLALEAATKMMTEQGSTLSQENKTTLLAKIAQYNYFLGNVTQGITAIEQAYALNPDFNSDTGLLLLITHGALLLSKGELEQTMPLYAKAEKIAIATENTKRLAEVYSYIAGYYSILHDDIQALKYFHQSYVLVEQLNNELEMMYLKSQMTGAYSNIHDNENAIKLGNEALSYFIEREFYFDALYVQSELANSYLNIKDYNKAKIAFENVIIFSKKTLSEASIPIANFGLAEVYFALEDYDKSREYLQIFHETRPAEVLTFTRVNYLVLEAKLAITDNNLVLAQEKISEVEATLDTLDKNATLSWKVKVLSIKAKIAYLNKDYESAYLFERESKELHNTYQNTQRETIRSKFKILFDTDQTRLQNKILARDKLLDKAALKSAEQEKWIQYLIILFTLALTCFLIFLVRRQVKTSKYLNKLANTDALTGLANRRFTFKYAENKLSACKNHNSPFAVVVFDIDHFKIVNDTYGHAGGDIALINIAKIANEYVREQDILGRIGGEEFLLVLPKTTAKKARMVAQRIRAAIDDNDFLINELHVKITASFGVSELSNPEHSFNHLFQDADDALYQAKALGRNRVEVAK
ncbi:GGDEF domain-containing protein [Colwellia sp. D2M02]|uniref:GGDEF domain-containing protein n=1 Tax=Colwellia sp. D2M02 TaxID=2841562 RepID=UPI001C09BAD5|nr:GGDEF domain-containing protein [Colwellia sp. D2M02]MBU2893449.1 GGDEF domain-containing protein [Colwellia sp. D2M02]